MLKTDLKLPEAIYDALSIYLLIAIGYKGGMELSGSELSSLTVPVIANLLLGIRPMIPDTRPCLHLPDGLGELLGVFQ